VYTATREGRADWPDDTLGDDVAELRGVRARIVSLAALEGDVFNRPRRGPDASLRSSPSDHQRTRYRNAPVEPAPPEYS
jgi:hypothetical protein